MKKYFDTLNAILERGWEIKGFTYKDRDKRGRETEREKNDKEMLIKNSISR